MFRLLKVLNISTVCILQECSSKVRLFNTSEKQQQLLPKAVADEMVDPDRTQP